MSNGASWFPSHPNATDDAELDRDVRMKLERSLESIVCAGLSRALRALPADVLGDLTSLAAQLGFEPGIDDNPSPIAFARAGTILRRQLPSIWIIGWR